MGTTSSGRADPLADLLDDRHPASPDGVEDGRHRPARVPLLSVPEALRSLELGVGTAAVRGVLVLALVAALVLAGRWAWVTQRADPVPQGAVESPVTTLPAQDHDDEGQGRPPDGAAATRGGGGQRLPHVVVHVTGAVHDPAVVTLPAGTRVVDAVAAAGGLTEEADDSSLNLARQLTDGEQLWVGRPGEEPPAGLVPPVVAGGDGAPGTGGGAGPEEGGGPGVPVDLNRATRADLEALPGVGPVTAGKILAWRDEHGGFSVVEELLEVSGIGERTLEQLQPYVTVGG